MWDETNRETSKRVLFSNAPLILYQFWKLNPSMTLLFGTTNSWDSHRLILTSRVGWAFKIKCLSIYRIVPKDHNWRDVFLRLLGFKKHLYLYWSVECDWTWREKRASHWSFAYKRSVCTLRVIDTYILDVLHPVKRVILGPYLGHIRVLLVFLPQVKNDSLLKTHFTVENVETCGEY